MDGQSSKLIFADTCDHTQYTLYNHTYFAGLIFTDSTKTMKIGPHKISLYTLFLPSRLNTIMCYSKQVISKDIHLSGARAVQVRGLLSTLGQHASKNRF